MTKSALLALAVLFIGIMPSKAYESKNDLKEYSLIGSVKTISIIDYEPKQQGKKWVAGEKQSTLFRTFNRDGYVTEEVIKGPSDQILYTSSFQPIGKAKLVEYKQFDDKGNLEVFEKGKLDNEGAIVTMDTYAGKDKLTSYIKSKFNAAGQVIQTNYYDATNTLLNSKEFGYDNNARLSFVKFKINDGDDYVEFYEYDKNGEVALLKTVSMDGTVKSLVSNEFNGKNKTRSIYYPLLSKSKEHQITIYNEDGTLKELDYINHDDNVVRKELFTYFAPGKVFKTEVFELLNGSLKKSYSIQYDLYNNEVFREFYDSDENPTSQVTTYYKFDHENNWIEKEEKENDKIYSIQKRVITYFEDTSIL